MRTARSAVEEAREANHALSLCYALAHAACPTMLWVEDLAAPESKILMLLDLSTRHAFPSWGALGRAFQGMLAIKRGDVEPGLRLLRAGFDEFCAAMSDWISVVFLTERAAAFGRAGQITEGLTAAEQAIERAENTEACRLLPESLASKASFCSYKPQTERRRLPRLISGRRLTAPADKAPSPGCCVPQRASPGSCAIGAARPTPWQLYDRFTEGFDAADLKAAKALLDDLS